MLYQKENVRYYNILKVNSLQRFETWVIKKGICRAEILKARQYY